jgi:hypothetical protein
MSFNENDYSPQHLLGNTNVPRNTNPILRAANRRLDPDGGSAVPYYADISGTTLRITYTREVLGVVTDDQVDVAFASNSYAAIIVAINAADATNLEALDQDGFLAIRNKNPGKTHRLEIEPWTVPADDAAPLFGFQVTPFPGSASYAGEIASAPGSRLEENPQGTALVSRDEGLSNATWNRSSAHLLQLMQEILNDLERDVIVFREIDATFETHPISNTISSIEITNDDLRLPIEVMGMAGETSGDLNGKLNNFFTILSDDGANIEAGVDTTADTLNDQYERASITNAFYATDATAFDDTDSFADWGTPDGASIYGTAVPNKDKHAAVAIESFSGNIAYCPGATFETVLVKKNDPVEITDPVSTTPFDHSGWFAVESVIDEEHIALRPMSPAERDPGSGNRPRSLNKEGLGDLRVAVGYFIPASSVWLTSDIEGTPSVKLRIAVGVPLREALAEDFALGRTGTWNHLSALLDDHINGAPGPQGRHEASQIGGFTTTEWQDGSSTSSGDNLLSLINDIVSDLGSIDGADRLASTAINIGGATPNTLAAGSIRDQLTALLTEIRDQVNYNGSGNWNDGTSIPAQNIETAIDQVVSDLAAETVGDDGAMKIGAEARGDLAAGSIADQLDQLEDEWGRLARAQSWTALNNFQSGVYIDGDSAGDENANPAILTSGPTGGGSAKLLWRIEAGAGVFLRFYAYTGALIDTAVSGFVITSNAFYDTASNDWEADVPGDPALIFVLDRSKVAVAGKQSTLVAWADNDWDDLFSWLSNGEIYVAAIDATGGAGFINGTTLSVSSTEIDNSGNVDVANGADVAVSGGGEYKHSTEMILQISAPAGREDPVGGWTIASSLGGLAIMWSGPGNGDSVLFDVPLKVGDRIKRIDAYIQDTSGGNTVSLYLHRTDGSDDLITGSAVAAGPTTSAGDGTRQTISITGLTLTIAAGQFFNVVVVQNSATSTTTHLAGIAIHYDRPP